MHTWCDAEILKHSTAIAGDQKEAFFSTSLDFAIKSKLDRAGISTAKTTEVAEGEVNWTDSVGAAQRYVSKEKDKKRAEKEEKEKKEKKAAAAEEARSRGKKGKSKGGKGGK